MNQSFIRTPVKTKWWYAALSCLLICRQDNLVAQHAGNTHSPARPNIVIIISDDHAYQAISAYGSSLMRTPNIDRIANEGVLFNRAYVTNSICGPSRATLLT